MGLSSSKHGAASVQPPSSSSGAVVRRNRSAKSRLLKSACLRSYRADNDEIQVSEYPSEENDKNVSCMTEIKSVSRGISSECYMTDKTEQTDHTNCVTSNGKLDDWGESSFTNSVSTQRNASRGLSCGSLNPLSRFSSHFSCYPGNLSFRLTRTKTLGSSNAYLSSSTNVANSNGEEQLEAPSVSAVNRPTQTQGCEFFPSRVQRGHYASSPERSDNLQDSQPVNSRNDVISRDNARIDCALNLFSPINICNTNDAEIRRSDRRIAARERIERNVRFSRTLSVGRLRERVLRRSLVPDSDLYRYPQDGQVEQINQFSGRQGFGGVQGDVVSSGNDFIRSVSSGGALSSIPFYGSQTHEFETPRSRDTRYRDLMEHQSNFIERRRRIRSQVRVLQRLGSRLGNISGHERSCILSGQHLAGHCTCHIAAREVNLNDDATARASISRIGMLAEALFEVLDEIHQQSVALYTRHSASSVASVPAPKEVVESLPLKIFRKLKKKLSDEAPQCYICLIEYEEGDCTRILPCHHEFHRACVDKWLKEIHRVCPLCRGDICRPDSLTTGS